MEGTLLLPSAVDPQGTSVHRSKYLATPEHTFDYVPSGFTGLAVVTSGELPDPIANPYDGAIAWEFFMVDDPFEDDRGVEHTAHAEVRVRRLSDRPGERNIRPKGAMKALLRHALVRVMRLFVAP